MSTKTKRQPVSLAHLNFCMVVAALGFMCTKLVRVYIVGALLSFQFNPFSWYWWSYVVAGIMTAFYTWSVNRTVNWVYEERLEEYLNNQE